MTEPIRIDGLTQFVRSLRKLDAELPKAVRLALNAAADVIVGEARPRIPVRTGRAARSVKAQSTRTAVRVVGGGPKVPYYSWLDFGGRVGRNRSVARPFRKEGRYIYAAYFDSRAKVAAVLERELAAVVRSAGLETD